MPHDLLILRRPVNKLRQLASNVAEKLENQIRELCEDPRPEWSEDYQDGATGTRRFLLNYQGKSWAVGYGVDDRNKCVVITSIKEEPKESQIEDQQEIRFFSLKRKGKPPLESFFVDLRRRGPKGYAKVLEVLRKLINKTIVHT